MKNDFFIYQVLNKHFPKDGLRNYNQLFGLMAYLLNLKFRKSQYDFGLRYAKRAYPKDIVSFLERTMFVKDISEIKKNLPEIEIKISALLEELQTVWS